MLDRNRTGDRERDYAPDPRRESIPDTGRDDDADYRPLRPVFPEPPKPEIKEWQ